MRGYNNPIIYLSITLCICLNFFIVLNSEAGNVYDVTANPNPFEPHGAPPDNITTISYTLTRNSILWMTIYDSTDNPVKELVQPSSNYYTENRPSGAYNQTWDGKDDSSNVVDYGDYFCHIYDVSFYSVYTPFSSYGTLDFVSNPMDSREMWASTYSSTYPLRRSLNTGSSWATVTPSRIGCSAYSGPIYGMAVGHSKQALDNCDDAWDEYVNLNVTSSVDTGDKVEGSASAKLDIADGAGAGEILATEAIPSTDISNYKQIRILIKSSVALNAGDLQLLLDDTASCASTLETLDIPALGANVWTTVIMTLSNPSSCTGIISIGVKMVNDKGAFTLRIDQVEAFITKIYALDNGSKQLWVTTDSGNSWNCKALWSGSSQPVDVACSPDGTVLYAVDAGLDKVYKSVNSGDSWDERTQPGGNLLGIAVDPNDSSTILVTDFDNDRVFKSTDSGSSYTLAISSGINGPHQVSIDTNGYYWVSSRLDDFVRQYDSYNNMVMQINYLNGSGNYRFDDGNFSLGIFTNSFGVNRYICVASYLHEQIKCYIYENYVSSAISVSPDTIVPGAITDLSTTGIVGSEKLVEDCDDAWDQYTGSSVTRTADTTDKRKGAASAKLDVADGAGAGDRLATEAISVLDLSNYEQIHMWIKSSVNLNAGDLQLLLDDTAQCPSPLETLNIPAIPANSWQYVTMTLSNPSSCTGIISIGVKMVNDKGAFTLRIDDVKAISLTSNSVELTWTAPGDDDYRSGTKVASYDVRYDKAKFKTVENCNDTWNEYVNANITSSADVSDKMEGAASAKLDVADGAGAGDRLATEAISVMDLSNYEQIHMWIKSSVNLNAGDLQLLLDDTAQCPSPLETLNIPAVPANNWQYVTMTLSNPSSCTAIISIGIKMVVDKGAFTLRVDDIKAGSLVTDTDFENATQAGGPTPKNQGNTQIFSVEGLESNTIYWFAVKSKDDLDNVSSLSTQNPFGKTGLLYDWNMVSCPLQPSPDDSMSVFGDDAGLLDWMWYWQSTWTGSTDTDCETGCKTVGCLPTCYCHPDCDGDWGQISNIAPGEGILLYSYATDNPTDATGTDITNASVTLSLNAGWNLIGNPYGESVNLSDCEVSYTSTESYEVAVLSYFWIGNAVYIWNGSTYDFIQWDEAKLEPWKGYWIFASYNLDLIIHTPSP